LEIEFEAVHRGDVVEAGWNSIGAEEDGDDREPRQVAAERGGDDVEQEAPRLTEDRAALRHLCAQLRQLRPEDAAEDDEEDGAADQDPDDEAGVVGEEAELDREGTGDREEEVEVKREAEDGERDLLDDDRREHHREGRAREQGGEHQQHHPGADVGRQEAVQRHRGRVRGEHDPVADPRSDRRRAQDSAPGQRREHGLGALQDDAGDDRPGRDLTELVEQFVDPLSHRNPEQIEDEDRQHDAADPEDDPGHTPAE
jgi:hypothetical protein